VDRGAVRQVLRHHKELAFRAPALLWEASKVWTTLIAILSLYLLLNKKLAAWGYNLIGTVSPWWALVPVGVLFLFGLMQANFEQYRQMERELDEERKTRKALERKSADVQRRKELKSVLAAAAEEGKRLHDSTPTRQKSDDWWNRVGIMISLALDTGEWRRLDNPYGPRPAEVPNDTEEKRFIRRCLQGLYDLIARVDSVNNISSDFSKQDWIETRPLGIKVPPQAEEVLARARDIQEAADP
jgi:hypothetical protein